MWQFVRDRDMGASPTNADAQGSRHRCRSRRGSVHPVLPASRGPDRARAVSDGRPLFRFKEPSYRSPSRGRPRQSRREMRPFVPGFAWRRSTVGPTKIGETDDDIGSKNTPAQIGPGITFPSSERTPGLMLKSTARMISPSTARSASASTLPLEGVATQAP
jgi:hypothetical protein